MTPIDLNPTSNINRAQEIDSSPAIEGDKTAEKVDIYAQAPQINQQQKIPNSLHPSLAAPNAEASRSSNYTQVLSNVENLRQNAELDLGSLIKLLILSGEKTYKAEREERAERIGSQVSSIKEKATEIKDEGEMRLIQGCVSGSLQIAGGIVSGVGAAKGAKSLSGIDSENMTETEQRTAFAQADKIQARWQAVGQTGSSTGEIAGAGAGYEATEKQAEQADSEAQAQKSQEYASQSGEEMQRLQSLIQNVIQTVQRIVDTQHESVEKSYY